MDPHGRLPNRTDVRHGLETLILIEGRTFQEASALIGLSEQVLEDLMNDCRDPTEAEMASIGAHVDIYERLREETVEVERVIASITAFKRDLSKIVRRDNEKERVALAHLIRANHAEQHIEALYHILLPKSVYQSWQAAHPWPGSKNPR